MIGETLTTPRPKPTPTYPSKPIPPSNIPAIAEVPTRPPPIGETNTPRPTAPVIGQGPAYPLPPKEEVPLIEYPVLTERPIPGTYRPFVTSRPPAPGFELPVGPSPIPNQPNPPLSVIPPKTGCVNDYGCQDNEACDVYNERCIIPCDVKNPCGPNTECSVVYHRPVCTCAPGFTGVPSIQCQPGK